MAQLEPSGPKAWSVAVLPFRDLSITWGQQYLCVGVAETIATALARAFGGRVASMASVRRHQNAGCDFGQLARRLAVTHIVEGRLVRDGEHLEITAQLTDVASRELLWVERCGWTMGDIFAVQESIVRSLVTRLSGLATDASTLPMVERGTGNTLAYELYLEGRFHRARGNRWSLQMALDMFRRASIFDPQYALAHANIADCYVSLCLKAIRPGLATTFLARGAAERAMTLDSTLPEARLAMGRLRAFVEHDMASGAALVHDAVRLDPQSAEAHASLALVFAACERRDAAIVAGVRACDIAPDVPSVLCDAAEAWRWLDERERAERSVARALALDPLNSAALRMHTLLLWQRDAHAAALGAAREAVKIGRRHPALVGTMGMICGFMGLLDWAEAALGELETRATEEFVGPLCFADVLFGLGRCEEALAQMERAHHDRSGFLLRLRAPEYRPLRERTAFLSLLRSMHVA